MSPSWKEQTSFSPLRLESAVPTEALRLLPAASDTANAAGNPACLDRTWEQGSFLQRSQLPTIPTSFCAIRRESVLMEGCSIVGLGETHLALNYQACPARWHSVWQWVIVWPPWSELKGSNPSSATVGTWVVDGGTVLSGPRWEASQSRSPIHGNKHNHLMALVYYYCLSIRQCLLSIQTPRDVFGIKCPLPC